MIIITFVYAVVIQILIKINIGIKVVNGADLHRCAQMAWIIDSYTCQWSSQYLIRFHNIPPEYE